MLSLFVLVVDVLFLKVYAIWAFIRSLFRFVFPDAKRCLAGECALITGAAHGLGREIALELNRHGCYLILWDINQAGLLETEELLRADTASRHAKDPNVDPEVHVWSDILDVSNRSAVMSAAAATPMAALGPYGMVTILINSAGILIAKSLSVQEPREIKRVFEVNVLSHFWTLEAFLEKMKDRGRGHVVAISSTLGRQGVQNLVPYCSTKFAVSGLMDALTEELRKSYRDGNYIAPVKTTTVYPGILNTGFIKRQQNRFNLTYDPPYCAKKIVDGIQRNKEHVYVPGYNEFVVRVVSLLPREVYKLALDFLGITILPPIDEE